MSKFKSDPTHNESRVTTAPWPAPNVASPSVKPGALSRGGLQGVKREEGADECFTTQHPFRDGVVKSLSFFSYQHR